MNSAALFNLPFSLAGPRVFFPNPQSAKESVFVLASLDAARKTFEPVHIPAADLSVKFANGELMRTEISAKFTRQRVDECFAQVGLRMDAWYTDDRQHFGLALAVPG